ncbi:MAG: response regulator transcription factor [Acidimicrobiia bacterium]
MRVLVVDDEVRLAEAVRRGLVAEGYSVDVSHDGLDGLWKAREGSFDTIVLDLLLPGMNGYQVCDTLRAEGDQTPILILTAKQGEYDEAEALDTGADDYLSKPFSFVVLLARLRALARRATASPTGRSVTVTSGLRVDGRTRSCFVDGELVSLSRREFDLLERLVRDPGTVVAKDELLDGVWGAEEARDPNIVEVYVSYLRRKLGRERIETVRGIGYRVVDDG